ncbi:UDP-galactopyranose mutase [bacterium]|nr:UDP-galactopyranose mutase [bacterium]
MNLNEYNYIVVGSGFFGAVIAERIANDLHERVLVIEKRNHPGGNCYSLDHPETGIHYHQFGTHIFHTSNPQVWNYIKRFTEFNGYHHQVLTTYKDRVYQMPINLETINNFYDLNLKPFEVKDFLAAEIIKTGIVEPHNFEEKALSLLGQALYEAFIKGYTKKQWGLNPTLIPMEILNRLPFRDNYDESYYFDPWQGIPQNGYTAIFKKMLNHELINVLLETDFIPLWKDIPKETKIIYSGPVDRLFDYKRGKLKWRSLSFVNGVEEVSDFQGTAVMNFAEEQIPYTRIHEPWHLHPEKENLQSKTLVIEEYSIADDGTNPYYPIRDESNLETLDKYQLDVATFDNLIVGGRLGDYKYYDMDQTIAKALETYSLIKNSHIGT